MSPLPGAGAVPPHLGRVLLDEVEEAQADPGIGDLLAVDRVQVPAVVHGVHELPAGRVLDPRQEIACCDHLDPR